MATYEPERTRNFYLLGDSQAGLPQQGVQVPRLFHFDLPPLKQTGQPFPEQADSLTVWGTKP
jgi:hypothetical protein